MRVLYFYQYFTTPRGAWSTRSYEFARRWVQRGDEVIVVTTPYDKSDLRPDGLVRRFDVDGIDVRVIGLPTSNRHGRAVRILGFLLYALVACWYALRERSDVILASSGPITVALPALLAHWVHRTPFVFEVRDLWPEGAIQLGLVRSRPVIAIARWLERTSYRTARTVVALSPGMRDWIRREHPDVTDVRVVPNAADLDLFQARAPEREHRVMYTGSLGVMDDTEQILAAAEELARRGRGDIVLHVLGDGVDRERLEARAADLGLRNLHFRGLVSKQEVARSLPGATCALITFRPVPVLDTVSPNKLFDALAAGVPVVQTTQGWIRELLEQERCGLTVPARDPGAMADAIETLVDDALLQEDMRWRARQAAERWFGRDDLAESMRDALAGTLPRPAVAIA